MRHKKTGSASRTPALPFEKRHCEMAARMKAGGLEWEPAVGYFVWDPDGHIKVQSRFANRIYLILDLDYFVGMFGSVENIATDLIWLPTWQQAILILSGWGASAGELSPLKALRFKVDAGRELYRLYGLILEKLKGGP